MNTNEIIFLVEEDAEEGFTARSLEHGIFTEGNSLTELKENIKDAVACHFEEETSKPAFIRLHVVREEVFQNA